MKLTIAQRVLVMNVVSIFALIVFAALSISAVTKTQHKAQHIFTKTLPSAQAISDIKENILKLRLLAMHYIANQNEDQRPLIARIEEQAAAIRKLLLKYETELLDEEKERDLLNTERRYFDIYYSEIKALLEKTKSTDQSRLWGNLLNATGNLEQLSIAVDEHQKYNELRAEELKASYEEVVQRVRYIAATILILSVASVGSLGIFLRREVRVRMNRLSGLISHVSETLDFTTRVNTRTDELGRSGDAFNKLLDKLQASLKSISCSAQSVASAANEMATTSKQAATASNQQSEAASGMAATIEEMTVSINHVAERAEETNRLSKEAGRLAGEGELVIKETGKDIQDIATTVNQAAELISGLERHSQQIANVVQVIKEVADQTNLLALNAAIEAARAGEQGRGFAVVADEVRKLAERTAASTQEIGATIASMRSSASNAVTSMEGVVAKVVIGVEKAQAANVSICQIGEAARGAVDMVEEIAAALRQQGSAANSIASQVERIAQMAEECSAAVNNGARAATELDHLSEGMQQIVKTYRI